MGVEPEETVQHHREEEDHRHLKGQLEEDGERPYHEDGEPELRGGHGLECHSVGRGRGGLCHQRHR